MIKKTVNISYANLRKLRVAISESAKTISINSRWTSSQVTQLFNAVLATNIGTDIDRYLRDLFETAPTVYDKAMDYGRILMNEKGYDHRLFDGRHSVKGAWEAVKDALPDDTLGQEAMAFFQSYWKDLVTPMGMPIITLDRENFDSFIQLSENLGIEKQWLIDLVSFTATETVGAFAAIIGATLNWKNSEMEEFARLAASLTTSSVLSANPLAMTVALLLVARSVHKGRKEKKLKSILHAFGWGTAKSSAFIATASLVGGAAWIGIGCGLMSMIIIHRMDKRYENKDKYDPGHMSKIMTPLLQRNLNVLVVQK